MPLKFETLWTHYGDLLQAYPAAKPCAGYFKDMNQCALRMSMVLVQSGISFKDYTESHCACKKLCWKAKKYAAGAESLANWLWKNQLGRPKIYTDAKKGKELIAKLEGLIFFKDCFTRAGENVQVGDHIDLWKSGATKTYDDPDNKSKQLWFWPLS